MLSCSQSSWAVSYTHLDVYKRQGQKRAASALPQGCIAVFLQGPMPQRRGQAHLGYADLLRVVAEGAEGRTVVAKAHPLQREKGQAVICLLYTTSSV